MAGYERSALQALANLPGTSFDTERGKKIRADLLARVMALLNSGKLNERPAQDCISFLLGEVSYLHNAGSVLTCLQLDAFPVDVFLDLVERLVKSTDKRRVTLRAFEFFPKIASLLCKVSSLPGCMSLPKSLSS